MPHTGPHQVELEQWISFAPFERLLNMRVESADNGRAVLSMPFVRDLAQGQGMMHGGAMVSLADTACCIAVKSILAPEVRFATIDLQSRILGPVLQGTVTAHAKVLRREGRKLKTEATILDQSRRPVMEFMATFKVARQTRDEDVIFPDSR